MGNPPTPKVVPPVQPDDQLRDPYLDAIRRYIAWLPTDEARLKFVRTVLDGMCLHCGRWEAPGCQCWNDE